ncbi:MAG: hypothetical protein ACT4PL_07055 [Phycisphaerales bacterium]
MLRFSRSVKNLIACLVASCGTLAVTTDLLADKVYRKDGTVLEGKIQRNEEGFVAITIVNAAGKEEVVYVPRKEIDRVFKDGDPIVAPAPSAAPAAKPAESKPAETKPADSKPAEAKPADAKKDEPKTRSAGGIPKIAILNFGPPSDWQGKAGNMVGTVVNAKAWGEAIPLLEKDGVTDVVVRINSGGGLVVEMVPFNKVFQEGYKAKFRTVAWVESAISCAAMSPWVLEEFYFFPNGNIGACTAFGGPLIAVKGEGLEKIKIDMENASRQANRSPFIMHAMQVAVPLSCNIDENGAVTWFQDSSGTYQVNPAGRILTLTANEAMKYKFGRGIAATPDELAKAMGYTEFTFGGLAATKFINDNMVENDTYEKKFVDFYRKYAMCVGAAEQLRERDRRMPEIGLARRHLDEMRRAVRVNPNISLMNGIPGEWFKQQDELLKELSK